MTNINAQKWLNEKYSKDKICKRGSDKENLGRKREEISNLNLSQSTIHRGKITLFGKLDLNGFSKLKELNISGNDIDEIIINDCLNLKTLNISHNKNIESIDLSANINLEEVNLNGCASLKIENVNYSNTSLIFNEYSNSLIKIDDSHLAQITDATTEIRNILIVGITGSGKSSLANTLSGSNFTEGPNTISTTKSFQFKEFEWNNNKYRVIDNIGFNDTQGLSFEQDLLIELGKGINAAKEGINQVLFLFSERFDESQIEAFNKFRNLINESEITKFTTIIRTNFVNFKSKKRCELDEKELLVQNNKIKDLISSCNKLLYINNPSNPEINDSDSEGEKESKSLIAISNEKKRNQSKEIVLEHLERNCNQIYKLKGWNSVSDQVADYLENLQKKELELLNEKNAAFKEKIKGEIISDKKSLSRKIFDQLNVKGTVKFSIGIAEVGLETELTNLQIQNIPSYFKN